MNHGINDDRIANAFEKDRVRKTTDKAPPIPFADRLERLGIPADGQKASLDTFQKALAQSRITFLVPLVSLIQIPRGLGKDDQVFNHAALGLTS